MRSADVVVIGAGPAGSAAATLLARAGRDVVVIDKATFPRDKCCGDGLTTLALRELEHLGLSPASVPSWHVVDAAWVRSPSGRVVRFPVPSEVEGAGQFSVVAPRLELDAALVELARVAGATVLDGHGVEAIATTVDGVVVTPTDAGPIAATAVVAADGMWSPTRRLLGAAEPGYLGEWHAIRQYFDGVTGHGADRLWVWFDTDLLPGYAWSFPLGDGRANVGFGILRGGPVRTKDMKALWPDLLARPHVVEALGPDATPAAPHRAWPIPARVDHAVLARGAVLFAGDAAMATDALTGEGIGQALLTGRLAAEAIVAEGHCGAPAVAAAYRSAVRAELVADHRMSMLLSRVLRHPLGARGAVRVAGASPWTRSHFGRWLFEDEPRAIVCTPRRWHRGFLARPGAYRAS